MDLLFTIVQGFFAFVVILSVLVFVHEYGHYIGCRILGLKVDSFSIGMGKEICGWTDKKGVRWKLSMLPFGGYLKMFGDDDIASGKANKELVSKMSEEDKKVSFYFQNPFKKFLVVFFGPLFNLIFAVLLLTVVIRVNGVTVVKPIVDEIVLGSPALESGIKKGDLILSVNEEKVHDFKELANIVAINNLKPMKVKLLRGNDEIVKFLTPQMRTTTDMFGNEVMVPSIGIVSKIERKDIIDVGVFKAFVLANKNVAKMCKDTLVVLGQMITGSRGTDGLGGPLKIAKYSAQSFNGGLMMVLYFMALISANLGLMNLLPIPVLDGGHLVFFVIEMLFGKPIPEKVQDKLLQGGFAILILIMIFATFNDVRGFF